MERENQRLRTEYRFKGSIVDESVVVTQKDKILFVGFYDKLNQLLIGVGEPGRVDGVKRIDVKM